MKNANPVSVRLACWLALGTALAACAKSPAPRSVPALTGAADSAPVRYGYEVVAAHPHDPGAFTQGLLVRNGEFLESTGLFGQSSLRDVEIATGRVLKKVPLAPAYFGEGLAVIGSRAYQLTWQNHVGFVYDADTFELLRPFSYEGEGWGLTTDGKSLIMSDGTDRIRFLDPENFKVTRTIDVTNAGKPVVRLNELEWIDGEIFANLWQTDEIVRIDPTTGHVRGTIDFTGLLSPLERTPDTDVLNGIAYDPATDRLFITGKRWSKIFEVRLTPAK